MLLEGPCFEPSLYRSATAYRPASEHPEAIFAHKMFDTDELAESLVKIGEWIARITASPAHAAYGTSRDLILKAPSRLGGPLLVATSLMASHQLSAAFHLSARRRAFARALRRPPPLNNHIEIDALGLKRRPVFKFLPCDRTEALASC